MYVGRRARLSVQEPANHNDIVEALGALDHAPGLHVQTTARLDHLAGLAQDLTLALDLLATVDIVRGKPHRLDEIGEGRKGETTRKDENDTKIPNITCSRLCYVHVQSHAEYYAGWYYYVTVRHTTRHHH